MKYYVYEKTPETDEFNTLLKCRLDIRTSLDTMGYMPIHIPSEDFTDKEGELYLAKRARQGISTAKNFKLWIDRLRCVKSGDIVLIQYPPLNWTLFMNVLLWLKMKGVYLIAIIHDLDSYRDSDEGKLIKNWYQFEDTHSLSFFNQLIVQNTRMKKLLLASGFEEKKMINIRLLDYLTEGEDKSAKRFKKTYPVVITGNFNNDETKKLSFIYSDEAAPSVKFRIYGTGVDMDRISSLDAEYMGNFPAAIMPHEIEGSFGLVWDGNSVNTCSGNWGEYLRIDNPLKFSLYLAAGIPVIIWQEAALAGFVKRYNIGITVKSLYEIGDRIKSVTKDEYEKMKENIAPFKEAVKDGAFIKKAIERAELRL